MIQPAPLIVSVALALLVRVTAAESFRPPLFSVSDLRRPSTWSDLASVLQTTGLLQISLEETVEFDGMDRALESYCRCAPALSSLSHPKGDHHPDGPLPLAMERVILADGATTRTTLGTATIGPQPLPLPQEVAEHCGVDVAQQLEAVRDQVALAADAFQAALDKLLLQERESGSTLSTHNKHALLETSNGISYHSIQEITRSANHLEHFHLYSKPTQDMYPPTVLEWHTDAGLFLAFVPGHDCDGNTVDDRSSSSSFWILDPTDQQEKPVDFYPRAIAIMLGVGAEHWLDTNLPLRATTHAVRMQPGQARVWYGMMHLVPESAIIQRYPEKRTFGDMRRNMVYTKQRSNTVDSSSVAIGCGNHDSKRLDATTLAATTASTMERRRLQHVQDASACNNSTNFFCWMQCLDIPDVKEAPGYINEGYSLYCLDPSVLASSSNRVSAATEPCENGYVHNANCLGSWQPTAPNVPAIPVQVDSAYLSTDEQWCYGGTSMYMDGFHWRDTVCVIFLFPQWVLTSRAKVAGASIATIVLGITLEKTIHHRRSVVILMEAGYRRLAVSAFMYGLQLTMGYLLMLILMTYSGPFFMCVVLGLMIGHVLFNAKDALLLRRKMDGCATKECVEECGQECAAVEEKDMIKACPCEEVAGDEDDADVPEGSTPCCQNTL